MRKRFAARVARCGVLVRLRRGWTRAGLLTAACLWFLLPLRVDAQSICAEVKIEIDQKVGLERQAFDAALKIHNGLDGVQVENISVSLSYKNMSDGDASGLFATRLDPDMISGISGDLNGSGTVAASSTGEAHWLIIPSPGAGGTDPGGGVNYQIGATIQYRMTGDADLRTVDVTPEIITVRPQPLLALDYFLAGDVYADDPNTPQPPPEETVPFTLGLRVKNVGAGNASHVTIDSAQPKIDPVNNPQGLLVHFEITGGYVDDQPTQPSLMLDFGDIAPMQSRMGRWVMTTDIAGHFKDFSAEFTHSDELGGALTSLIESVNTHLLARDVVVDLPQRDDIRDFLALDGGPDADPDVDTYRVYESNGIDTEVLKQFTTTFWTGPAFSFPAPGGPIPVYARAPISFDGLDYSVAATHDGVPIRPENVWFSKRRKPSGDGWLYFVNVFEANASACVDTCAYMISYQGSPQQGSISGRVYFDANANGTFDAGDSGMAGVTVHASDGSNAPLAVTVSDGTFQILGLNPNTYSLTVDPVDGYFDGVSTAGSGGGATGTGAITNIAITAGLNATGYAFAKLPQPVQQVADLAVTSFTTSTSTPRVGDTFTITLQIANGGPNAAPTDAGLTLPSSIVAQSATASTGTFDTATGHWAVGNLPASSGATLTVQALANATGSVSVGASVQSSDASIFDPNTANNVGSLPLDVHPANEVNVTATFVSRPRLLALVACAPVFGMPTNCVSQRTGNLDGYLTAAGVEHLLTTSASTFRDEMRSGHWNVYWIDNSGNALDSQTLTELGLAVLRGDSLIVDGISSPLSALNALLGVTYSSTAGSTSRAVTFAQNDYLGVPGYVVSTPQYTYTASAATVLATYPDGTPAITFRSRGNSRLFMFAYDFVTSIGSNTGSADVLDQLLLAVVPPVPAFYTADAYASSDLHLANTGHSGTFEETATIPTGTEFVNVAPTPRTKTNTQVVWRSTVASGGSFDSSIDLRTQDAGTEPIAIDVVSAADPGTNLAHQELPAVVHSTTVQGQNVATDIGALNVVGSTDTNLKTAASRSFAKAVAAYQAAVYDDALAYIATTDTSLAAIVSADTTAARIDLGWYLQAAQRTWYTALTTCATSSTPPAENNGLSFVPFAANEGLYLHQINPGGFEWRLGADTTSSTNSVGGTTALVSGQTYTWTLTYDGAGNGTISVRQGTTIVLLKQFTGSANALLNSGNAMQLFAKVLGGAVSSSITVHTTNMDGSTVAGTLGVTATGTDASKSMFYYGESLRDGFSLAGDVAVTFPTGISPPPRISFLVNAGTLSCLVPGR